MKKASFPALVAARKAAEAQLNYYRSMMGSTSVIGHQPKAGAAASKVKKSAGK